MIKTLLFSIFLLFSINTFAKNIDAQISSNKKDLEKNKRQNRQTQAKINSLSKQISSESSELKKINDKIEILNGVITTQKEKLSSTEIKLNLLEQKAIDIEKQKEKNEENLINIIIENFSWSFALEVASKESFEEIVDSEIYKVLSSNTKEEISKLNKEYQDININKKNNEKEIVNLKEFIEVETKRKEALALLQQKQKNSLASLEKKHIEYQNELKQSIKKQKSLSSLLGKLNILKQEEIKKEQDRQKQLALEKQKREQEAQTKGKTTEQKFANNIDIEVRMLGSSTKGIKIGKYKGAKTIAPLKSYEISKKFGKYFDPVYKIELFNESVILKTKEQQAKVYNVLNGKVVYAKKDSGMLENVVIIQHSNGLHTIYSHLDQISPTIKVGKWIKKGYVVGRVDDILTIQATKNSTHINPQELF